MRVFVYEFVTAGGMWSLGEPPAGSLLAEGRAMAEAISDDFAALGASVRRLGDSRLSCGAAHSMQIVHSDVEEREAFLCEAARADWTLVIAPETGGMLHARCGWVTEAGGRLLSPGPATVVLASDKQRTAEHLAARGVRAPRGLSLPADLPRVREAHGLFPAVLKPLDGCGSQGVRLLESAAQLPRCGLPTALRLEQFVPGTAASVAVLCGAGVFVPLPACQQLLSDDGRFAYSGGRVPLPAALACRAQQLAVSAVQTLPDPRGYIGVDLVLGSDASGAEDYVIELNPRLTTSYVGLRALCRDNLAAAMLDIAEGRQRMLSWYDETVEFTADGRIQRVTESRRNSLAEDGR
jgi:hypothetical protein